MKKNWFIIIKTKKKWEHNKPNLKMYVEGHCTIHTCQYNEGKFDLEIYLSVICSLKYSLTLTQSKAASF